MKTTGLVTVTGDLIETVPIMKDINLRLEIPIIVGYVISSNYTEGNEGKNIMKFIVFKRNSAFKNIQWGDHWGPQHVYEQEAGIPLGPTSPCGLMEGCDRVIPSL